MNLDQIAYTSHLWLYYKLIEMNSHCAHILLDAFRKDGGVLYICLVTVKLEWH